MTKIQGVPFEAGDTAISVGFLRASDLSDLHKSEPLAVYAYEPNVRAATDYRLAAVDMSWLRISLSAVGADDRTAYLTGAGTKGRIVESSAPGCCPVNVVSLTGAIAKMIVLHDKLSKLLLNCEGSEYEILDGTPSDVLAKCRMIFVQFHHWLPGNDFTEDDTERCIDKLKRTHRITRCLHRKYHKYLLERITETDGEICHSE